LSTDAIDRAITQSWVARTVILAPTDKEANEVGMPHFKAMQTYRAAQSEKFDAKVSKANASMAPQILCGAPDSMMEEFTELKKTGIGGCIVRFRTGPMPADFAQRGLQLFMQDIAPALRERTLEAV
jgi:alkanesulfonate monooxygenase SsuD/methylene tetrahydromethanopterin reductase-like flavin-dependent oxidoreductase (luciferase family)